jgi:hypothetical protein
VNYTVLGSNRWNAVFVITTVQDWEINAMQILKKNGTPPRVEDLWFAGASRLDSGNVTLLKRRKDPSDE